MNEILTKNELTDLTGYKSNARIAKWLKSNRVPYMLSGEGTPKVHREALAFLMGVPIDKPKDEIELDFNHDGFKL